MKKLIQTVVFCYAMVAVFAGASAQEISPTGDEGFMTAINIKERKMMISDRVYRVALSARLIGMDGKKMLLENIEPGAGVTFELDKETNDLTDLTIIAYP